MDLISNMDALFKPRSVAMIGASATPGKLGYDILYNLIHAGLKGPFIPSTPKPTNFWTQVYKDISSLPTRRTWPLS